jgi:DNA replication ATP-dependent helicase Dna2
MEAKRKRENDVMMTWLTTPPFKQIPGLVKRQREIPTSSPTCLLEPSPILLNKTKKMVDKKDIFKIFGSIKEELNNDCVNQNELKDYTRFVVLETTNTIDDQGKNQLIVKLLEKEIDRIATMYISGDWLNCHISTGKIVNVISKDHRNDSIYINNDNGLLVIDPDELISASSVSDSFQCLRSAVLKGRLRYSGQSSRYMIHGNIAHALFQEAVGSGIFTTEYLTSILKNLIKDSIEDLYAVGTSDSQTLDEMTKYISLIQDWHASNYKVSTESEFKMVGALQIEERIWSPKFGLKGNIDVTAEVIFNEANKGSKEKKCVIPLELKTGKNQHISHRAQASLYKLMAEDRYKFKVEKCLLVYILSNETNIISVNHDEIRGLLIGRNAMASYYSSNNELAPLVKNYSVCKRCYISDECMIYHKVY